MQIILFDENGRQMGSLDYPVPDGASFAAGGLPRLLIVDTEPGETRPDDYYFEPWRTDDITEFGQTRRVAHYKQIRATTVQLPLIAPPPPSPGIGSTEGAVSVAPDEAPPITG